MVSNYKSLFTSLDGRTMGGLNNLIFLLVTIMQDVFLLNKNLLISSLRSEMTIFIVR